MRCVACDKILNDVETTRKSLITGEYYDLCNHCFSFVADDLFSIEGAGTEVEFVPEEDIAPEGWNPWNNDDNNR